MNYILRIHTKNVSCCGKSRGGFTVVEMLIGVCIAMVISFTLLAVLSLGYRIWQEDMNLVIMQQTVRTRMDAMTKEIRQSQNKIHPISIANSGTHITFYTPFVTQPIQYYLTNETVQREHPTGTVRTLSANCHELTFCCVHGASCDAVCTDATSVRIKVGMQKNVQGRTLSFSLLETVGVRND